MLQNVFCTTSSFISTFTAKANLIYKTSIIPNRSLDSEQIEDYPNFSQSFLEKRGERERMVYSCRSSQGRKRENYYLCSMNDSLLASSIEEKLAHRDIRSTASRILVLRALMTTESALSLSDLEAVLPTLDKSTIFRTLTTFAAHHLVHVVEDGSGLAKYALCADDCHCGEDKHDELSDLHTHFYCERCQRTFCLRGVPVPVPVLPEGFSVRTVGFVVKGICDKCSGLQG